MSIMKRPGYEDTINGNIGSYRGHFTMTIHWTRACLLAMLYGVGAGRSAPSAEFTGLIEPYRIIKIGSPQVGVLATVDVDRGDVVKAGQVVATLQSDVEKAAMEVARYRSQMESGIKAMEVNKSLADRKKTRLGQLYGQELIPFSDLDEVETARLLAEQQLMEALENKKLAELDYKRTLEALERMTIRSPVNGVVVERFLHPAEHIETEAIMKIAQIDPLNVELILPKTFYLTIKVGMRAQVAPEAPVGGHYTAVVKIVDKVIDGASGTFGVRLELPNPDNRLPAGIKCKVIVPGP